MAVDLLVAARDVDSAGTSENIGDIAMFSDGGYVAVFLKGSSIYARIFDATKTAVGSDLLIAPAPATGGFFDAEVAAANEGRFVVVYEEFDSNGDDDVRFQLFNGSTRVASGQVNSTDQTKSQNNPDVAMTGDGKFVVTYEHEFGLDDNDLFYRRYSANGVAETNPIAVQGAGSSKNETNHSVAASRDGTRFGVTWEKINTYSNPARDSVFMSMFDFSGNTIVSALEVPDTGKGVNDQETPTAAMDDDGDMAIAWIEDVSGSERIMKRTYTRTGFGQNAIEVVGPNTSQGEPRIAVGRDAVTDYAVTYVKGSDIWVAGVYDSFNTFNRSVASGSWIERTPRIAMSGQNFVVGYIDRLTSVNNVKIVDFGNNVPELNDDVGGYTADGMIWLGTTDLGRSEPLTNRYITSYSPAVQWVDPLVGDFDNDGSDDFAMRIASTGEWWLTTSNGTKKWTQWNAAANWRDVVMADINNDGYDDILGRTQSGSWYAGLSDGSKLNNVYIGSWSGAITWADVLVGDFNGDFKPDLIGRVANQGQWWVGLSSGTQSAPTLSNVYFATWSTAVTWSNVRIGDFDGDGKDDLIGQANGGWWLGRSTGVAFQTSFYAGWNGAIVWKDALVGDFDGDGRDDIAARVGDSGSWWAATSNGTVGTTKNWTYWSGSTWDFIRVMDLNQDGRNDILGWDKSTGRWTAAISTGYSFKNYFWGQWNAAVNWRLAANGNFDG